jgi:hypothetical protein
MLITEEIPWPDLKQVRAHAEALPKQLMRGRSRQNLLSLLKLEEQCSGWWASFALK